VDDRVLVNKKEKKEKKENKEKKRDLLVRRGKKERVGFRENENN